MIPPTWLHTPSEKAACTVIAEVAQAHDGSLGMAHAFIDAIATTGADAVKFQTHIAAAESTPGEPWRVRFSPQDETRYDYWKRMEFTPEQWAGLKRHCEEKGLLFLSSPFSEPAFELLDRIGVAAWKVASGEITNKPLLERMARTGLPMLLSTGMSPLAEIDRTVAWLRGFSSPLAVLQCTSEYPCGPEHIGINNVVLFRERYGAAGLSDHSGTIYPGLAAAVLGAQVVEVHVTLSRHMFGPDVPASLTIEELTRLVEGIRFIETMLAHPQDKDRMPETVEALRPIFMKSVVTRQALPAGTRLEAGHLTTKKPGTGIPAWDFDRLIGRRLRNSVPENHILTPEDLED
ncbi:N,N'-diacetyllegionaminate synthase [Methylomarinovum tepidoasis]|uniref:N,N'-diacetyllegionaminate synthase n=1 Tax=Methylomarinovum tepidoasis TaxID=2840183 RepID=A0AAU9CFI0_9GAMM|nr:N,N'-diacetyllegionaminate synthase [Methylomarinovum sp. IN45]